jgi:hypothetical protein
MPRKPFRLPERIITLFFEDGPYEGLEVDVSLAAPQGLFWQMAKMADLADDDGELPATADVDIDKIRDLLVLFGGQIRGWNLQAPDGSMVPATADAFADQLDQTTQWFLVSKWLSAVRSPPASLPPRPRKRRTSARK